VYNTYKRVVAWIFAVTFMNECFLFFVRVAVSQALFLYTRQLDYSNIVMRSEVNTLKLRKAKSPSPCLITQAMDIIGKKWVLLIMYQLLSGPKRFTELEAEMAISGRLLSERLKEMEMEGIVTRHMYPEIPPRVEYELTPKGKAIEPVINQIYGWSSDWLKR
jgi:DNA-binding HxlR family transcriptional regulator